MSPRIIRASFNTQPPEGGCGPAGYRRMTPRQFQHTAARRRLRPRSAPHCTPAPRFNTQPPEGGCHGVFDMTIIEINVSTHSRPKAAAAAPRYPVADANVSTHSRPKAAAQSKRRMPPSSSVSTHSRPKAAAVSARQFNLLLAVSTHSRPKAAASGLFMLWR